LAVGKVGDLRLVPRGEQSVVVSTEKTSKNSGKGAGIAWLQIGSLVKKHGTTGAHPKEVFWITRVVKRISRAVAEKSAFREGKYK